MSWKLIVVGGIVFYAVMLIVSFATGPLIHEGVLEEAYKSNEAYWQPALAQDPPDTAALMPRWITVGLITAFVLAAVFGWIRSGFSGSAPVKGLKYGLLLSIVGCCMMAGWSGVFGLPVQIWMWWGIEQFFYYLPGGAVLGWVGEKLAPEAAD